MLKLNSTLFVSPLQYSRTVLVDQRLVVRLQLVDVGELGALCVQVKFVELLDPGQHAQVFVIAQVHVVSVGVPGVERMKANHVQPLLWDGAVVKLHNSVEILVMAPGHEDFVESTV